ncbi:MAG: hypothetical protein Q7U84_07565, partial [Polynucleobacter sp.]|nr:hypothetical protein [Polynucleobacter sp.]
MMVTNTKNTPPVVRLSSRRRAWSKIMRSMQGRYQKNPIFWGNTAVIKGKTTARRIMEKTTTNDFPMQIQFSTQTLPQADFYYAKQVKPAIANLVALATDCLILGYSKAD